MLEIKNVEKKPSEVKKLILENLEPTLVNNCGHFSNKGFFFYQLFLIYFYETM